MSSVNAIANLNSTLQSGTDTTAGSSSASSLSQADFLKLLVTQMESQDPMNPTNSQDLLTQTVQLSTLQSNNTLQTTLSQLQTSQALSEASSMLGRQVTIQTGSSSGTATPITGLVTGVDMSSGSPQVVVNGVSYDLSQVTALSTSTSTSANQ
jgi:flagellar basal-body rod modification protein FlgD